MEGKLLSREADGEGHAFVLLVEAAGGGAEQHVLSFAATYDGGELEGAGAGQLSLLSESFAENHSLQTAEGGGC